MATVHPQMRLVTWLNICVWSLNMLLVAVVAALGIYLWLQAMITPGALAVAFSLAIRLSGMSHWIMWEVSNLFENIGTVQDGINTLANPLSVVDRDAADRCAYPMGGSPSSGSISPTMMTCGCFAVSICASSPVKKSVWSGARGRASRRWSTLLLRFYDVHRRCNLHR